MADYPHTMQQLLEAMFHSGASDLHLKARCPPGLRVDGHLCPIDEAPVLTPANVEELVAQIAPPEKIAELKKRGDLEFAHDVAGISRYRVSLVHQRGSMGAVLRRIPVEIPDIDRLGLPPVVKKLAQMNRGLVLVTGPTGSGKSTTLAAMIDFLNRESSGHIITMEDPIEFAHVDRHCFITQREIGTDCESFGLALRRALRHDPDVIMIGELRDRETISLALTAAETGHLVLATVHTPGTVQTVDRMLDAFPADERIEARSRLAASLQGVLSQVLVPKTGGGRVAALEVLIVTEAVRSCIREGKTHQIQSQIQTGGSHGMQTQATSLADLIRRGMVTEDLGLSIASNVDELRHQLTSGGAGLRATKSAGSSHPLRRSAPNPVPVEPMAGPETVTAPATITPAPPPLAPPKPNSNTQSILEKLRRS